MSPLCLDCIGLIISFLESSKTLFNLLLLSKRIRNYIGNEGNYNCINIEFDILGSPNNKIE